MRPRGSKPRDGRAARRQVRAAPVARFVHRKTATPVLSVVTNRASARLTVAANTSRAARGIAVTGATMMR
eukprot:5312792-Lingulodinium_polyedra.AAC.1